MTPLVCPQCQRENSGRGVFCIFCGATLSRLTTPPQPEQPVQDARSQGQPPSFEAQLRDVRRELQEVGQVLDRLTLRLVALEFAQQRSTPQHPPPQTIPPSPAVPRRLRERVAQGIVLVGAARAGSPVGAPPASPASPAGPGGPGFAPPFRGVSIDWENVLGRNWFAIVGAVALAIGVGFFLKLAFDNDWIGDTGRIVLGIVVGVALLGAGEYTQRRYPLWAQPVTGGGIAILYLSIYAAFGLYELIDIVPTLLFLSLVVVLSVLLALRYESLVIALMGVLGGLLTPVLMGVVLGPDLAARPDLPNEHWILLYILVLDAGILGVATFRNWRWFTLVGMVGSYILLFLWLDQFPGRDPALAQLGLSGTFLVFVGATTLFHILWRRIPGPADMALMTLNAAAYYGLSFEVLWDRYEVWFGLITLGMSLFYGLVGYGAIRRSGAPPQVALFALATALIFLTVAVPLQLSGNWVSVAWAAEGAVLVWVGFLLGNWPTRAYGLVVLAVALFRLLIYDTPIELEGFRPVLNERFPTFVVAIAAFYVAAYLYQRWRNRLEQWEGNVSLVLAGAANFITLWIISAEVIAYFDSRERAAISSQAFQDAENGRLLALTGLWAVYAFGLLAVAMAKRSAILRWAGLALLAVPILKLLFVDTFLVDLDPMTFRPVLNFHFLTFLIVLAVVLFAAVLYWRQREELKEEERLVFLGLLIIANIAALWVLSAEAIRYFDSREIRLGSEFDNGKHLTLTILWAVYALGVIGVGIARQASQVRLAGIILLAIPVVKLFVFDVFLLERGFRVAAFVTLGALLLALGFVYQRYSQAVRGFLFGKQS